MAEADEVLAELRAAEKITGDAQVVILVVKQKLKKLGPARGTGTSVYFSPDEEVFGAKLHFDPELISERLEAKSYLHGGLVLTFTDETKSPAVTQEFVHPQGIADFTFFAH